MRSLSDQPPDRARIERAQYDGGHAAMDVGGERRERAHVEERQREQVAVAMALLRRREHGEAAPERRLVRVYDALGQPRRARGVHDVEIVIAPGAGLGLVCRGGFAHRRVIARKSARRRGARRARAQEGADVRRALALAAQQRVRREIGHGGIELRAEDQDGRAAVVQDVGELLWREPPVERHADRAELCDGKEALDEFDAVHQQERHAVALLDTERAQRVRGAVAALVHLGVREAAPGGDVDDRLELRVQMRALREQEADVVLHGIPFFAAAPAASRAAASRAISRSAARLRTASLKWSADQSSPTETISSA